MGKNNIANDESENAGGTILGSPFTNIIIIKHMDSHYKYSFTKIKIRPAVDLKSLMK